MPLVYVCASASPTLVMALAANKTDLEAQRQVSAEVSSRKNEFASILLAPLSLPSLALLSHLWAVERGCRDTTSSAPPCRNAEVESGVDVTQSSTGIRTCLLD